MTAVARLRPELEAVAQSAPALRNDSGNAQLLVDGHGEDLRHALGGWLCWQGMRQWQPDEDGELVRRMQRTARDMLDRAMEEADDAERQAAAKHAISSGNHRRLMAASDVAATDPRVVVRAEDLDADPMLLGVGNGTVDLVEGRHRAPRRADLITRTTGVTYDADADCPRFERFAREIFGGDVGLVDHLQRLAGYCLTGRTDEHVLPVLHGSGCNGKSVLVNVLGRLLGGYAATAPFDTFTRHRDAGPRNDLARLRGARLVTASESSQGSRLDEATIKSATGGDVVAARFLYSEYFEYRPEFKVVLVTNHPPRVDGGDQAIWRRLRLIPFNVSFEGREDRDLETKLLAELPGILNWAIEGCLAWQRDGLNTPDVVMAATREYRAGEDTLGQFLEERCGTGDRVVAGDLRAAYESWCESNGERAVSGGELGKQLKARGITTSRTKSARFYDGIHLYEVTGDRDDSGLEKCPRAGAYGEVF